MQIQAFFDQATSTLTYVVADDMTRDCIIVDPVLDFDPASGSLARRSISEVIRFVRSGNLRVGMILETHVHADHLSASQELKREFPQASLGIGVDIQKVQETFKRIYLMPAKFSTDGSQFDVLLRDGERIKSGSLTFDVIATPGHTAACTAFNFAGRLFTGDTLFMPDYGVGRTDFPGGSAETLFDSVSKLYRLPDETCTFTGHDYQPGGRPLRYESTIAEQKSRNVQLNAETKREGFVKFRQDRDAKLTAPRLLHFSVQVNIDAGRLPEPAENGVSYLKFPLTWSQP